MENFIKIDLILNYIKTQGISKAKLAKQCGISICTLNKILNGKENIQ